MKPVVDKHTNSVLKAPKDSPGVIDLPITRMKCGDGTHLVESCWKISDEEFEVIKNTRKVYFTAIGETHPPILLQAISQLD